MPSTALGYDQASATAETIRCRSLLERLLSTLDPAQAPTWADRLTEEYGSVGAILATSPERRSQICQAGPEVGALFELIRETVLATLKRELLSGPVLPDMGALLDYVQAELAHRKAEQLRVFFLDAALRLLRDERVAAGSVDALTVYPREIIRRALELGATGLILVHNHPSGHTRPSDEDVRITLELRNAARPLGIDLHDHVIVGPAGFTSFRTEGLL